MVRRTNLHDMLKSITNNVYFQPPSNVKIKYPAIIYELNDINNQFANDGVYIQKMGYRLMVVDPNPESNIMLAVSKIPTCKYDRAYAADGLNHYIFTIYY